MAKAKPTIDVKKKASAQTASLLGDDLVEESAVSKASENGEAMSSPKTTNDDSSDTIVKAVKAKQPKTSKTTKTVSKSNIANTDPSPVAEESKENLNIEKTVSKPKLASDTNTQKAKDEKQSDYTVVARRYRPQQLSDLIGQEHVAKALTNAISSGRIAHAYLFTGARGVGKTSSARILAKALNCEKGPTATPCDQCTICSGIIGGDDPDVLEIDGASNNKVDEIRELRVNTNFRPARARYKIYIIDEVHMLTVSAFNALLKTLEEPPPHIKFILATTEVQKIPITILSRCQRFDFAHIGPNKVFETLKHIVSKEGIKAEDAALRIVAKRAGGSMRDAQSLLDQLLAFCQGHLTAEILHSLLGTSPDERIVELANAILREDAKASVDFVAEANRYGMQLGELLDQLIEYWRAMMLVAVGGSSVADAMISPILNESVLVHAKDRNIDSILAGLDILTTAKGRLRGSTHVNIIVEATVIRLCRLGELVSVNQLALTLASGKVSDGAATISHQQSHSGSAQLKPTLLTAIANASATANKLESQPNAIKDSTSTDTQLKKNDLTDNSTKSVNNLQNKNIVQIWPQVLKEVGVSAGLAFSKAGDPAILGPNSLALRFSANYSHQYEIAANSGSQARLIEAIKVITGEEWIVRVEKLISENGQDDSDLSPSASTASRQKEILQHKLLHEIITKLGGQVVRMENGFNPKAIIITAPVVPVVNDVEDDNGAVSDDEVQSDSSATADMDDGSEE